MLTHIDVTQTNQCLTPTYKVAVGEDKIKDTINDLGYEKAMSEIFSVAAQYTLLEGVVVQVFGCLQPNTGLGLSKRLFVQTFFLAVQEGGYYVRNDIFRYLFPQDVAVEAEHGGEISRDKEQIETPEVVHNHNGDQITKEEEESLVDGEEGVLENSAHMPKGLQKSDETQAGHEVKAKEDEGEDEGEGEGEGDLATPSIDVAKKQAHPTQPPPPTNPPPPYPLVQQGGGSGPASSAVAGLPPITTGPGMPFLPAPPVNGSLNKQQNHKRHPNQHAFQVKPAFFPHPSKPSVATSPSDGTNDSPASSNGVGPPSTAGSRVIAAPEPGMYPHVGGRGPPTPHRTGGPGSSSSEGRRPPPPPSSLASSEGRTPGMEFAIPGDNTPSEGIFIRDIPNSVTQDDLKKALEVFGHIKPGCLTLKTQKQRDSYAFVDFQTVEAATACLEEGLVLDGKKVTVQPKRPYIFKPTWGQRYGGPMGNAHMLSQDQQQQQQHQRVYGGMPPLSENMNGSGQRWAMPMRGRMLPQPPPPPQGQAMMHGQPHPTYGQPGPYMAAAYPSTMPPHMVPMAMAMMPSGSGPHHPAMTLDPSTGYFMPVGMTGMGNMVHSPPGMVGLPVNNNPLSLPPGHISSVRSNSRQRGRGGRGGNITMNTGHQPPPPPLVQPPPPPGAPLSRTSSAS